MVAPVSCIMLLLVTVSCTRSQWSKPIPASGRRSSTLSEDWVPVVSPCPTCPKEAKTKVVARQADLLLQPPPAYQPSAQSTYLKQALSAQQHEIQNHFNAQGLPPVFIQTPGQFFNEQFATQQQRGASSQQLVSPQVSYQQIPAVQQFGSPQPPPPAQQLTSLPINHQPISAIQQLSHLSQQLPSVTQQLTSPQSSQAETAANQQLASPQLTYQLPVSPKLSHQQISADQHLISPELSHEQITATQFNNEQLSANQQLISPLLNHKQEVLQNSRRLPSTITTVPGIQEEVQLLYVPVDALRQNQQAAVLRQQQQAKELPNPTTEQSSTTLQPYQPPLSVFMGLKQGHDVRISDVVKVLRESKTISVLDTVGPNSPQVFVGPSNLHAPEGYAKFELPYLSALESNTIERKVEKLPFFVAPLSFKPPAGYSKIPFPAPHVGSVVIGNVTENEISKKDHARKTYSLPAELPPINPELPSLVNSLQDPRNIHLATQNQDVTKFLQAVQQVKLETTTEQYSRTKLSRNPYDGTEVRGVRQRQPSKETGRRFQQSLTQYQEVTTVAYQPQYLQAVQENKKTQTQSAEEAEVSKHQPPYVEFDKQSKLSQYGKLREDITIHQPQISVLNPTNQSHYQQEAITGQEAYTDSHKHIREWKTNQTNPPDGPNRAVNPAYHNSQEDSRTWKSQYHLSEGKVSTKMEENKVPRRQQYSHTTEQPRYISPQNNIPAGQTQYSLSDIPVQTKSTNIQEEISTQWPQNSEPKSGATKDTIPTQEQYSVPEPVARPPYFDTPVDDAQHQIQYSKVEENDERKASKIKTSEEGIVHQHQTYQVVQDVPENTQHAIPQHEQQYPGLYMNENTKDLRTPQEHIFLRQEGVRTESHPAPRDETSQHRSQNPVLHTDISQKHSKQYVHREKSPNLHSQNQDTEEIVTANPNYTNLQEQTPSLVTQFSNSPDRFQSQYPIFGSEVLMKSVGASTTTVSPVRTTLSRGRNRGRYRHSNFSTTTPAPRTRSSYSRGRRPATRTTSEAPEVQASAADQVSLFESSRQHSERAQAHRYDTQQRDKTRSRNRGSSTTTTASPEYKADLHREEQTSKIDTVSENFPIIISQRQEQATTDRLTITQSPNGQVVFTHPHISQPPQSQGGQINYNQVSNSQISYTHLSSGLNSDGKIAYSQIPKDHVYIPNTQDLPGYSPNRNKAEQQTAIGQAAQSQNINDEASYLQVPAVQTANARVPYGTLYDTQTQNTKIAQNHISGDTEGHGQIHAAIDINNQVLNGKLRSNQIIGEQEVYNHIHSGQAVLPKTADDYHGHSVSSADSKQISATARTLSNTAAASLPQDGFLQHEIPELTEYTTQRQNAPVPNVKHRNIDFRIAYQTTFSPPMIDEKVRQQGDSYIVTTDSSAQDARSDVTQRPSFVRIRGRVRGRQRKVQQTAEKTATISTVSPEYETTAINRKNTNFINRGSARKTEAPTTTTTPETTSPVNDKIYTVRPSRRPQQPQTRLTTKARIRRPTRPPTTTTISAQTTPSGHGLNEVPDAFTTEVIPTTRETQFALQPEYEILQQYQPRQPYQSIQSTRDSLQQYHLGQHYQTVQRQQGAIQQYQPQQHYQSTQRISQLPIQQYRPEEQRFSVEQSRVADQTSLPSDNHSQYGFNDPESGQESQWSGKTLPFNPSNAIPNVTQSIETLQEVTMNGPETTVEADNTTETIVSATEGVTLMLTALPPDTGTTTPKSTTGHGRRRGNWVRARIKPQQQQDILETAESQNLATVAAANQIAGETAFKQITESQTNEGVTGNDSPTSSSSYVDSDDYYISKPITESSNTRELYGHHGDSLISLSVASDFNYENTTAYSEAKSSDNKNVTEKRDIPLKSPSIKEYYGSPYNTVSHKTGQASVQDEMLPKDQSEVTSPYDGGYSTDEMTTVTSENKFATTEDFASSEGIISSRLVPSSSLDDPLNQDELSKETSKPATSLNENANENKTSMKENSSWKIPSSNLEASWNQDLSRIIMKSVSAQSDDSDSKTTVLPTDITTPLPERQASYTGLLLPSLGYYDNTKHESDKNLNWGVYEDWWGKTYANHRPYYTDEQSKLSEEKDTQLQENTSIWNMESFKTHEDSNSPADVAGNASNTSLLKSATTIKENVLNVSSFQDYPHYDVWEETEKNHHSAKHSVKKANPKNVYDKHVTIKDIEGEPSGNSNQDLLAAAPENGMQVADVTTVEYSSDAMELSTEHSDLNLTESTPAHADLNEMPYDRLTTQPNILSTSDEFRLVPSNAEHIFDTEHTLEDENVIGTDKSSHFESKEKVFNAAHSTESSASLIPESNIKRTDTRSLMAKILGTTTSTKISHETEICYKGRCIKTKTKDSDIDQLSTD